MYGIGGQVDLTVSKISGSMVSYDSSFPALSGALMIEKNSPREMELWCLDLWLKFTPRIQYRSWRIEFTFAIYVSSQIRTLR